MGSFFHTLDINEDIIMARKAAHKRHVGGLDAPRNSLELQMETSHGLYSARDNILYAHNMANESSDKDYYFMEEAPIKELISEEISEKPNTRQNVPSLVARLMGIDMLPFNSNPAQKGAVNIKNTNTDKLTENKPSKKDALSASSSHVKPSKPKAREHPQEEELQKFKKEFEAWQAARFQECANLVEVNSAPTQSIAQKDINREKIYLHTKYKRTNIPIYNAETVDSCKKENLFPYSKIVILRPGMDIISEDSCNTSTTTPGSSEGRDGGGGGIEEFLQEVKERLKSELQGTCPKVRTSIRGGIETHRREKPSEQQIAQEVRDSVSRDLLGMKLLRSESTRSYRIESQWNERNTRRILADRLSNVLREKTTNLEDPTVTCNSSSLSMLDCDGQSEEKHSRSFRRENVEGGVHHKDVCLSPRNLIRSMSAPVSGTSFGKLLLEDRHVLTGAQIRRKHEVTEKVSPNIKKQKKEKFNIREKVSSFRYSWAFRGGLFRRRVKSVDDSDQNQNELLSDIRSGPTVMMRFYETHENSTEVPPSPASVCSSVQEELWREADYLSPISSSGGQQLEDGEMSHVFREINSNLNELRRKLDQLEGAVPEEPIKEEQLTEVEVDIEDQTEAYVRDLLIAGGLYDGSSSQSLSKFDPLGKPISTQAFEEVEGTYDGKEQGKKVNHRVVFDMLNEVLPTLLREPVDLYGRKLLSRVWNIIRLHVHAPPDNRSYFALDNVLARDLMSTTWARSMDDDVNGLSRDIECRIIGDMIYDVVQDICEKTRFCSGVSNTIQLTQLTLEGRVVS